jgi:SAM-dependent methyltransferase
LLLNPVSSVRYFEFDFSDRNLPIGEDCLNVLDISSPWLFGFYSSERRQLHYHYINADRREVAQVSELKPFLRTQGQYECSIVDATAMPFADASFDAVVSISVIEHLPSNGDTRAVKEIWRVLRPGGRLILTFPVSRSYEEEYRSRDEYQIGIPNEKGRYFFQRYYDESAVRTRLLDPLPGFTMVAMEFYGEREEGFFRAYEKRWLSDGLKETIKDPYLMARNMKHYREFDALPGIGIAGVSIVKSDNERT